MSHLIFFKEGKPVLKRAIDKASLLIGRDPEADIQLCDSEISRRHCLLERENKALLLHDTSRNGTFVNHKRITTTQLSPYDQIRIGSWVFKLEGDLAPPNEVTTVQNKTKEKTTEGLGEMVGVSKKMQAVFALLQKGAGGNIPICLLGESGTGKEVAARTIHQLSQKKRTSFVAVNCGAIPKDLIESLLFGHEKGSFTGASEKQVGVFEQADKGTLFLDEIGEMPLTLQTRLLRILETKTVRRIGGKSDIPVSFRLITATHKNLKKEVASRHFRQDLFYRLYIFPISLPPLRERKEDIELLAAHFLTEFSVNGYRPTFTQGAFAKLKSHPWHGNVRELKNVIQRTLLLATAPEITAKMIDLAETAIPVAVSDALHLWDHERLSIIEALRRSRGNVTQAAEILGIHRTTLNSKIRRYKMKRTDRGSS